MLGTYLNQTAQLQICTGTDDRGQSIYTDPVEVACRRQAKTQNVLTAAGQTIQTQHIYYLKNEIREGDMLDGRIIMGVFAWTGFRGERIGYKAVM